jgi:hypothetical protein
MKKEILLFSLILVISSVLIQMNTLYANNFLSGNNDTIVYAGYAKQENISIFPNPVINNTVTLTSGSDFNEIEILNIVGRSVFQKRFKPAVTKATLNLKQFNKGIYFIRVSFNDNTIITEKIMIE